MSELVADCPRCDSKRITFSLTRAAGVSSRGVDWQLAYETFCTCRHCHRSTIFVLMGSEYAYRDYFSDTEKLVAFKGAVNAFMKSWATFR